MKMKRLFYLVLLVFIGGTLSVNAQVTVGANSDPNATLDVVGQATDATVADGVIAPRLTGDQIKAKDAAYGTAQTGAIVYATAAVGTASTKTAAITAAGYYYFDGTAWKGFGGGSGAVSSRPNLIIATDNTSEITLTTTQLSGDHTALVIRGNSSNASVVIPTLGEEDKGKLLSITFQSKVAVTCRFKFKDSNGLETYINHVNERGVTFICLGTEGWVKISY